MRRLLDALRERLRATAEVRRQRALRRAEVEKFDETHGGSIWRSGRGGGHPDR